MTARALADWPTEELLFGLRRRLHCLHHRLTRPEGPEAGDGETALLNYVENMQGIERELRRRHHLQARQAHTP